MILIRVFLWTLVGAMTFQGFMKADEYGAAASMIGGMALTMSVWKESASTWLGPKFVPLPRVIVQTALKETALHPNLHIVPRLQATVKTHQRTWELFRELEINWLLGHADLIGGVLSDPDGRITWTPWHRRLNETRSTLAALQKFACVVRALNPPACDANADHMARMVKAIAEAEAATNAWEDVLGLQRMLTAEEWFFATQAPAIKNRTALKALFITVAKARGRLHDIEKTGDPRLSEQRELVLALADSVVPVDQPWIHRVFTSLLMGEIWTACLEHIRQREGRVRELMIVAGIQDMYNTHERILNASLRTVKGVTETKLVQDWFGEMSGYAWFMSDLIPTLVRRCIGQEAGDCTRIGPTEIVALTAQIAEKSKIVDDWSRRVLIGMWNALPAVALIFVLELVTLCLPRARPGPVLKLAGSEPGKHLFIKED